jgi:uncharacterized protein
MSTPTQPTQRIVAIDVLRGFALLGILVMNIQFFAMPAAAYFNPTAYGDLTGANRWVWILSHLLTDHKMMNIFSMLYGAGIVLLTERLATRNEHPLRVHYRRTVWLLVIGLAHAYLLWAGDILVTYALTALVVVWFRKLRPRWLVLWGLLFLAVSSALMVVGGWSLPYMPPEQAAAFSAGWQPTAAAISAEVDAYRGGWLAQMAPRVAESLEMHTGGFFFWGFWRAGGLMLLGMALFKWGVFSGERSRRFYRIMLLVGLGIGLPLVAYGIVQNFAHGWTFAYSRFGIGYQYNYWASLLVSLGYVGGVMLIVQTQSLPRLTGTLAAVGRMAFTNYLLHTLIATTIFYGHGLALFGSVNRVGQILIVFAIWGVQLVLSPLWLAHFRFGPVEWLWRALTYWQLPPLRRVQTEQSLQLAQQGRR